MTTLYHPVFVWIGQIQTSVQDVARCTTFVQYFVLGYIRKARGGDSLWVAAPSHTRVLPCQMCQMLVQDASNVQCIRLSLVKKIDTGYIELRN